MFEVTKCTCTGIDNTFPECQSSLSCDNTLIDRSDRLQANFYSYVNRRSNIHMHIGVVHKMFSSVGLSDAVAQQYF